MKETQTVCVCVHVCVLNACTVPLHTAQLDSRNTSSICECVCVYVCGHVYRYACTCMCTRGCVKRVHGAHEYVAIKQSEYQLPLCIIVHVCS